MINKITPVENSLLSKILLCDKLHIDELPNPNIVPLFGPNGIGKSSVINALIDKLHNDGQISIDRTRTPMTVLSYRNSKDNSRVCEPRSYEEAFDPGFLMSRIEAQNISEGQSIMYSALNLFDIIGTGKNAKTRRREEYLVLIDEIDSGLSLDNLDIILRKLKNTGRRRKDVQVIFSFNNPYVLQYFPDVLSLYTGHPIRLETPEDMLAEIRSHEKEYRKIRYRSNNMPKQF